MGPYALAGSLRSADISTTIIDYFTRIPNFFNYLETFLSQDTYVVGISSTFLAPPRFSFAQLKQRSEGPALFYSGDLWFDHPHELETWLLQLKALLKRKSPRASLILGGAKSQAALYRNSPYHLFDQIVVGPADRTLRDFVLAQKNNVSPKTRTVNGRSVLDNQQDVTQKFCPESLMKINDCIQREESLPIEISRGCVFNCKFCHYDKKESFKKPLSTLKEEFIRNYELFGTRFYSFCDDCFNDHPRKVEEVCNLFLSLPFKIEWSAYSRVDVAVRFPETADLMVESGARGLYWGLESFNHIVARNAGKGTPTEKVQEFLIQFYSKYKDICIMEGSFVTGLPGETFESLQELENWLVTNPVLHLITVGALNLMPYVPNLDKTVIDYAEYSRHPEKYGFKEIRFGPHYWQHETMNSNQATEWAQKIGQAYRAIRPRGLFRSIWAYPHLRGLGFSEKDSFNLICNAESLNDSVIADVKRRFNDKCQNYWKDLQRHHSNEKMKAVS